MEAAPKERESLEKNLSLKEMDTNATILVHRVIEWKEVLEDLKHFIAKLYIIMLSDKSLKLKC